MMLAERNTVGVFAFVTVAVVAGILLYDPSVVVTIVVLPSIAAVLLLAWAALYGNRLAILLLIFVTVFMIQAVFRVREYEDKGVDFQVFLKLAVYALAVGVAFIHARRWIGSLLTPINISWIMLLLWLFATIGESPSPTYTAGCAFTVFACVAFCAYVFSVFEPFEVLATMVLALFVFCVVSIIVYFAIPEFGHYVYWLDGQRYLSPRLSGISGSANNMGSLAAFGLIIMALYPLEFYRLHRALMPLAALVMLVALALTNSRSQMMNMAAIVFALYAFRLRRFHLLVFTIALILIGAALLYPAKDAFLMLFARHGNIEEVTSMTGRTEIWYAVLKLSEAKPWTGYGYGSSIFILPQHEREVGFLTSHAHNLFLQLLLTTGWVGLILFSVSVLGVGLRAAMARNKVVFAMLGFVLLNGITESSGFTTLANICTLAYAIAVTFPLHRYEYANDYPYQRRFS